MAVTRIKSYHGSGSSIKHSIDYSIDKEKTDMGKLMGNDLTQNTLSYAANPKKTTYDSPGIASGHELVTGYMCDPDTAAEEFRLTMDKYYQNHEEHLSEQTAKRIFRAKLDDNNNPILDEKGEMIYDAKAPVWHDKDGKCRFQQYKKKTMPRTAYMWVLSFPPERVCGYKIDPRICHQIGLEFIKQIDGGQYQAIVATHLDREHPHDHIVMCAYAKDGSHKYRDTKDNLIKARQICDDLSQRFGLPIIPVHSQEQSQTISWTEWKARQEGQSWKEQMRQDINSAIHIAQDYDQFISLMKSSGYKLRETENHLTYIMPGDDEYRCRDTKLGREYEKNTIKDHFVRRQTPAHEREEGSSLNIPAMPAKGHFKPVHIYISRYTFSGRRRTDLEMLFLTAIKVVRALKDIFRDPIAAKAHPTSPIHQDYNWKLTQMMDSLKYVQQYGIETKGDLDKLIKETGTKLSVAKKELRDLETDRDYAERILGLLEDAQYYMQLTKKLGFDPDHLYVDIPNKSQLRENLAKVNPATPSQRRELYLLLQKYSERYRLGCKYDQLNAREAEVVIRFLKNETDNKPDILYEGRWQSKENPDLNVDAARKEKDNNALFESHLLDYSSEEQQIILYLRDTVRQLADLGIGIDDYASEKSNLVKELQVMNSRLQDVEKHKQQYRNLKRLEYNYNLASNTAFTHGASYDKEVIAEVRETKDIETENETKTKEIQNQTAPNIFSLEDPFFDQIHSF